LAKVKKKYLGNENIALHYSELIRKRGLYSKLRDNNKELRFWTDILNILNNPQIIYRFVVVDKDKAKKLGWISKTIVEKAYAEVIKQFVVLIKKNRTFGRICTESDPSQDVCLLKVHNRFQSVGINESAISSKKYQEIITSLSLVNKNNLDPEIQIADLLGYSVRTKYRIDNGEKPKLSDTEKKKLRLIDRVISIDKDSYKSLI